MRQVPPSRTGKEAGDLLHFSEACVWRKDDVDLFRVAVAVSVRRLVNFNEVQFTVK
jgi:hypothetical protein